VRLRLTISKPSFELMIAEYKTRNGLTITLNVTGYDLKTNYEQSFFNFNTSLFKDVEIVDLR